MLMIKLKPTGKRNRTSYRVVVMEKRSKLEGRATDDLGYYNPFVSPAQFSIDKGKMETWVKNGAHISVGIKRLLTQFAS